ncbi:MAG TPA: 16S rRNA (cytosine(1402)-N(4))-methyltransferase RsmH [Candidatus Saccharimonadales bacterium]|nr:16S rRNA (cytosine(1402)-N(4))-methyltransferase RsmH [Candidatus Saccharimonadales bacterium]
MEDFHKSVLFKEALEALNIVPGEVYLDATLGSAGHTRGILDFGGDVVALEIDQEALNRVAQRFEAKEKDGVWLTPKSNLKIINKNFKDLDKAAQEARVTSFSGILFDLGVSSLMFDRAEKGFSFSKEGPLDMRMDQSLAVTAADLVNGLSEKELNELFTKLGEIGRARLYARAITEYRLAKKIETTTELAGIINRITKKRQGEINPATAVFMALRIAVNDELNNLEEALPKAAKLLRSGGRLVVISFHSLEDRIVKNYFKNEEGLKVLTEKPIVPTDVEIAENRRARSAKMRVAEKI